MAKTHHQLTSGQRFTNSDYLTPWTMGSVLYVSSVSGTQTTAVTDASASYSPEAAYTTLALAHGATSSTGVTASNDDEVVVLAGHTESITGAAAITFSKAGVWYRGRGVGRGRPTLTWGTSTAAQIIISGARTKFTDFVFDFTGIDAVVAAISITAADVTFEDCEFITNSATAGCVLGILTAATADRLTLRRCQFTGAQTNSGTTTTAQVKHEVGAALTIEDCYFTGKMTQAILNATTVLRANLTNNKFHVYTGTAAFTFEASSTGFITGSRAVVASGTTPWVGNSMSYSDNRYTTEANGPTAGTADSA